VTGEYCKGTCTLFLLSVTTCHRCHPGIDITVNTVINPTPPLPLPVTTVTMCRRVEWWVETVDWCVLALVLQVAWLNASDEHTAASWQLMEKTKFGEPHHCRQLPLYHCHYHHTTNHYRYHNTADHCHHHCHHCSHYVTTITTFLLVPLSTLSAVLWYL
jgi:hypothetical protein